MTYAPTFIYYTTLGQSVEQFTHYLNQTEQKRLATFTNPIRRQSFIAGRVLLAVALATHHGNADYQIAYSKLGKPYLHTPKGWYFNLTHSSTHLYLALQQKYAIGIDCEVIRYRKNYLHIAEQLFGKAASEKIANHKEPLAEFLSYWTQYEAYIKYFGKSIFSTIAEVNNKMTYLHTFQHQQQIITLCTISNSIIRNHWFNCKLQKNICQVSSLSSEYAKHIQTRQAHGHIFNIGIKNVSN